MGWATKWIEALRRGETVRFRPSGNSMSPRIESRWLCTVEPLANDTMPAIGDVVLCRVKGADYLHLVKAISGDRVLIGNNRGGTNGWTSRRNVYGRLVDARP